VYIIIKFLTIKLFRCSKGFASSTSRYTKAVLEWGYLLDIVNFVTLYFVTFGFLNYVNLDTGSMGGLVGVILSHLGWGIPTAIAVLGSRYIWKMQ